MGIRMLHRRTPEAVPRAWADTFSAQAMPPTRVPALAADASTARNPADLAVTVRRVTRDLRRRLAGRTARIPDRRQWAGLARACLALALTQPPRARPRYTLTVFVASFTERPAAPGPHRSPHQGPRNPRPDAGP
ncbi:hypothetical protein [Streptomyces dangxiongensis]|uniref:hypothetical protein n=1 Tax=Streptomyces dangxiongensis TaxID=1442032 RepID=UPI001969DA9B|nr:hypothetical protein [Streptomyces dangxiongensis]